MADFPGGLSRGGDLSSLSAVMHAIKGDHKVAQFVAGHIEQMFSGHASVVKDIEGLAFNAKTKTVSQLEQQHLHNEDVIPFLYDRKNSALYQAGGRPHPHGAHPHHQMVAQHIAQQPGARPVRQVVVIDNDTWAQFLLQLQREFPLQEQRKSTNERAADVSRAVFKLSSSPIDHKPRPQEKSATRELEKLPPAALQRVVVETESRLLELSHQLEALKKERREKQKEKHARLDQRDITRAETKEDIITAQIKEQQALLDAAVAIQRKGGGAAEPR